MIKSTIKKNKFLHLLYLSILIINGKPLEAVQQTATSLDKKVNVLTLNTALLTVFFGQIDINMKNNNSRAELIGKTIKDMSTKPDIIVFQEAFDSKALRNKLYKEIKDIYPHTFFDTRQNAFFGGGVDSGLAILSRYPITRKLQKDFSCWAGVEALARKGIMGAEISIDGCPFYMFTAHFQAGVSKDWYIKLAGNAKNWLSKLKLTEPRSCEGKNPDKLTSEEIINIELHQAKKEIDSFVKDKNAPIIFAGDFNISRLRDLVNYNEFLKTFPGALDTYINGSKKIKSSSWEKGTVADTETDRVDYVWLLNPSQNIKAKSDIIDTFTDKMTDHLGLIGTIEFNCKK